MIAALVLLPLLAGLAALLVRRDGPRRTVLLLTAFVHLGLSASAWRRAPAPLWNGWLALDPAGRLFLGVTSLLFAVAAVYAVGFLAREEKGKQKDADEAGAFFLNGPEAIFVGCLLFFFSAMTFVTVCQHFGLLWVAVEATTLASAPLIYFHRNHRSLEAVWKYLVVCSVGIALALVGNLFLAVAAAPNGGPAVPLVLSEILNQAGHLNVPWLRAALVFFFVGYGTKMGLAPMHTWLPDAHSESPSVVSALLSGALLNCAFLALWRAAQTGVAAGQAAFVQDLFLILGLASLAVAAVFILGQTDFKRLLAYSSVEHMGVIAFGMGIGGSGVFAALLHSVNHSLVKGMLFLLAGNILAAYRTKAVAQVRGVSRLLPVTGPLWLAGFFAISGMPPFGTFLSELLIVKAGLDSGRWGVTGVFLLLLTLVFIGMSRCFLNMAQGRPDGNGLVSPTKEKRIAFLPSLFLGALSLWLGLTVPGFLQRLLQETAARWGG
ncbi:MAG TPA: proton-conducting transporter membrane subunit [Elusimicrobiota bacterium]|nr:proton-conducting transporter membrane subunit [Elusimicrobiota bacterium]